MKKITVKLGILAVAVLAAACVVVYLLLKPEKEYIIPYPSFIYGTQGIYSPYEAGEMGWNGHYVWYGGIKWRILSQNDPKGMLLFADSIPDDYREEWTNRVYQKTEESFVWFQSDIYTYLNKEFYKLAFTDVEQMAIEMGTHDEYYLVGSDIRNAIETERIFLLTEEQAREKKYGLNEDVDASRVYEAPWWLLEGGNISREDHNMSWVNADGAIMSNADPNDGNKAIRPAFHLNKSTILFARDAQCPEDTDVSSDLKVYQPSMTFPTEWLFILSSSEQNVQVDSVAIEGDRCKISYSEASVGEGNYLSAIIMNKSTKKVYAYGKIADTRERGEGTVEIALPWPLKDNECLMVFSEQDLGRFKTGYASKPATVLTKEGALSTPVVSVGELDAVQEADSTAIINDRYDTYLSWTENEYVQASRKEKLNCGVAALMYEAVLEYGKELTESEIAGGEDYVKAHEEQILSIMEMRFSVKNRENETLKEIMDKTQESPAELAPEPVIYMGDYEKYLDYTGQDYINADTSEQQNIILAAMIYLVQVRGGEKMDEEGYHKMIAAFSGDSEQAKSVRELLGTVFGYAADETVREVLGGQ